MNDVVRKILENATHDLTFPGASFGMLSGTEELLITCGQLTYAHASQVVTPRTMYDIASVTKSIPVACLIMQLVEQDKISLDDRVIDYIPEIDNNYREKMLIRHLLTYTVVYDLKQGLGETSKGGRAAVLEILFHAPLKAEPGTSYFYTNAPAILLGLILERLAQTTLDVIANERFFKPLGMSSTTFHPEGFDSLDIAPTEVTSTGEIRGVVHDESAAAFVSEGFVAGNAGVFSTASDLLIFCRLLLNGGDFDGKRYFQPNTVQAMYTPQLNNIGESAGLGWEMGKPQFMGTKMSTSGFGKTGFTGTIVLIDPVKRAMVLLSNRTFPDRPSNRDSINLVRRELADLVFGAEDNLKRN
jgi:CubicO group peptidase (beta-lactamase class C family)